MEVEQYYSLRDEIESKVSGFEQHDIRGLLINIAKCHKMLAFVIGREDFERMAWEMDAEEWEELLHQHLKGWIDGLWLDALRTYVADRPDTSQEQGSDVSA